MKIFYVLYYTWRNIKYNLTEVFVKMTIEKNFLLFKSLIIFLGLPTKNKTVRKTQKYKKYDDLELDFGSNQYFEGLINY